MKKLKLSVLWILCFLAVSNELLACHGMPLQNYIVTVGANGVTINANSNPATCGCGPYWLQTEVSCTPGGFLGTQPSCMTQTLAFWNNPTATSYVSYPYFNSLLNIPNYNQATNWFDNCVSEPYNPVFIPFSGLCPGKVYYIRSREVVMNPPFGGVGTPFPSYGAWTAVQSFTVPGAITPTGPGGTITLNLSAAPPTVFCGGGVQLTAFWTGSCNPGGCGPGFPTCEATVTVTPTYSWSSSNPVTPTGYATATSFLTGSVTTLNIPSLTSTTTFSVWLVNILTTSSGTSVSTPTSISTATSVATGPAATYSMALANNCQTGGTPCTLIQPGVVTVNVINTLPSSNVTVTPNACLSAPSFTFNDTNTSAGMIYNWNFGDGSTGTGNPATHSYAAAGIYTVTLTKGGGGTCSPLTTTYTVQVYPNPTSALSVNSPICVGGTASFTNTQTNGSTYNWSGPSGFSSTLQNPVISNVTAAMAGVYSCTTTSSNGCSIVSTVNLSTYQASVSASSSGTICAGTVLNLNASGTGNYSWTGPNGFSSTLQNPSFTPTSVAAAGIYTVNSTLTGNCAASATVAVAINSVSVTASAGGPICSGNILSLSATGNGSFSWSGPNGFTSTLQNPTIANTLLAGGIYTVTVTSPQGCVASTTVEAVIIAPKTLSPKCTPTLCEGGTIYFETLDGSGVTYQWTGPNGFSSDQANTAIQTAVVANSGQYTITLKDQYGCYATGKVSVNVSPKPTVDIDMSKAIAGCAPVCNVQYLAKTSNDVSELSWSLGNGSVSSDNNPKNICYNSAGNYSVVLEAKGINGCSAKTTKILEVYPVPTADFSYTTGLSWISPDTKFVDKSSGANIANWFWTFGMGPDVNSEQQNPSYNYQDSGTYNITLKVKSDKGCESTVAKKIRINDEMSLYVPNAFSPNGDGNNDVFMAVSNNVNKFDMSIFDRWGTLVFHSSDIRKGWDGTFKGSNAESAVYVYKISYTTKDAKNNTITGSVTLVR